MKRNSKSGPSPAQSPAHGRKASRVSAASPVHATAGRKPSAGGGTSSGVRKPSFAVGRKPSLVAAIGPTGGAARKSSNASVSPLGGRRESQNRSPAPAGKGRTPVKGKGAKDEVKPQPTPASVEPPRSASPLPKIAVGVIQPPKPRKKRPEITVVLKDRNGTHSTAYIRVPKGFT
jgi:hypothetical protein